jgi:hypothetical protein
MAIETTKTSPDHLISEKETVLNAGIPNDVGLVVYFGAKKHRLAKVLAAVTAGQVLMRSGATLAHTYDLTVGIKTTGCALAHRTIAINGFDWITLVDPMVSATTLNVTTVIGEGLGPSGTAGSMYLTPVSATGTRLSEPCASAIEASTATTHLVNFFGNGGC